MQTIRGRLTAWYSAALVLTLTAFAVALYVARRRASYDELDQRIRSEAELTTAILGESYRARGVLVTYDSTGKAALVADIKAVLEAVPDYLLITAQDGEILYSSSNASLTYQQVVQLRRLMTPPLSGRSGGTVRLEPDGPELRYLAHIVSGAGPRFGSLLVAADVRTAELAGAQLLSPAVLSDPIARISARLLGRERADHAGRVGRVDEAPAPGVGEPGGERRGGAREGRAARRAGGSENGARDAAGAGIRARGCEPYPPADPQPRHQRGEVYPVGRQRPDAARAGGRPRHPDRRRHRDRHRGGRLASHRRSGL